VLGLLVFVFCVALCNANSCNGTTQRIYFIGNSFTYYNEMPEQIYAGLVAEGFPKMVTTVQSNTEGGRGLYDPIPQAQKDALEQQTWDFVVLQDYSETPGLPDTDTNKNGSMEALQNYYHPTIRDKSKAKAIFYETWGYCCGDTGDYPQYTDFLTMNSLLKSGYEEYRDLMNKGEPPATEQSYSSHINPVGMGFFTSVSR